MFSGLFGSSTPSVLSFRPAPKSSYIDFLERFKSQRVGEIYNKIVGLEKLLENLENASHSEEKAIEIENEIDLLFDEYKEHMNKISHGTKRARIHQEESSDEEEDSDDEVIEISDSEEESEEELEESDNEKVELLFELNNKMSKILDKFKGNKILVGKLKKKCIDMNANLEKLLEDI